MTLNLVFALNFQLKAFERLKNLKGYVQNKFGLISIR